MSQDYNKPLFIPVGSDSFKQIESSGGETGSNFELWKHAFSAVYPQVSDKTDIPDDPRKDERFKDAEIDAARKAKDEVCIDHCPKLRPRSNKFFSGNVGAGKIQESVGKTDGDVLIDGLFAEVII